MYQITYTVTKIQMEENQRIASGRRYYNVL